MVKEIIRQTISKQDFIHKGEHIVIGLSGGPDSVCLFHVLTELQEELNISLYAVHVNHKFRPEAAERDQAYVEELCRRNRVPCETHVYDCTAMAKQLNMTSEEAGRKARYEAFGRRAERLVQSGIPAQKIKIAVAQNADDQAETILLRLLRGTGPDGLAGISYSRMEGNFQIIRPLLDVRRRDIEAYCREKQLVPCIDHTNLQPIYTRNKIRLQLLPFLREHFNPNISESLIRLGRIAGQDKAYLHRCANQEYEKLVQPSGSLDLDGLCSLETSIRHRVIMKALNKAGLTQDISAAHLENADRLLQQSRAPASIDFPEGYKMALRYGEVLFYHQEKQEEQNAFGGKAREGGQAFKLTVSLQDIKLPQQKETSLKEVQASDLRDAQAGGAARAGSFPKNAAVFDWDKLCAAHGNSPRILLRTRQAGDFIRLKQGRKKIQDFFVDQKIPKDQRNSILMAAAGTEILWIIAPETGALKRHRYSQGYLLDHTTKKVLSLEITCEM